MYTSPLYTHIHFLVLLACASVRHIRITVQTLARCLPVTVPVEFIKGVGWELFISTLGRVGRTMCIVTWWYTQVTVNYVSNPVTPKLKVSTTQLPLSYLLKTFWLCHDPAVKGSVSEMGRELGRKRHTDCGCIHTTVPKLRTCKRALMSQNRTFTVKPFTEKVGWSCSKLCTH